MILMLVIYLIVGTIHEKIGANGCTFIEVCLICVVCAMVPPFLLWSMFAGVYTEDNWFMWVVVVVDFIGIPCWAYKLHPEKGKTIALLTAIIVTGYFGLVAIALS